MLFAWYSWQCISEVFYCAKGLVEGREVEAQFEFPLVSRQLYSTRAKELLNEDKYLIRLPSKGLLITELFKAPAYFPVNTSKK